MEFLLVYLLFAVTTAIMSCIYLLAPVMGEQDRVDNKIMIYIVFFLITIMIAPFVFPSTISNRYAETFKLYLSKGLFE